MLGASCGVASERHWICELLRLPVNRIRTVEVARLGRGRTSLVSALDGTM